MQVTAIKKNLEICTRSEIINNTRLSYPVNIGDTYEVLGLSMAVQSYPGLSGVFVYYYKADERMIFSAPVELFTITEVSIHEKWEFWFATDKATTHLGPPELFEDPYFIEDLTDSEPEAVKKMYEILQILDI